MPRRAPIVLAACLIALAPGLAAAQGPTEPADFTPTYEEQLLGFEDATIDTGWIPNNSPVQMRFYADAANSIIIDLPGTAYYDWQTEELRFEGDPMAGFFEYDIGLELVASVKVDVSLAQWQSELLGPYDWGVQAATMFTPYLLEGNPDRPAMIQDQSGAFDLVSIPLIPDIIIISGNLDTPYVCNAFSSSCDPYRTNALFHAASGVYTAIPTTGAWGPPGGSGRPADPRPGSLRRVRAAVSCGLAPRRPRRPGRTLEVP